MIFIISLSRPARRNLTISSDFTSSERRGSSPYHASRADLLRRLSRFDEATAAYETALSLTTNRVEQNYIRRRLAEMSHKKSQKDHQAAQN